MRKKKGEVIVKFLLLINCLQCTQQQKLSSWCVSVSRKWKIQVKQMRNLSPWVQTIIWAAVKRLGPVPELEKGRMVAKKFPWHPIFCLSTVAFHSWRPLSSSLWCRAKVAPGWMVKNRARLCSLSSPSIRLAQNNPSGLLSKRGHLSPAWVVLFLICWL